MSTILSFDNLNLHTNVLRGIYTYGFETPSCIQNDAIPAIISKRDTIAQAQSGTGKTGAFVIGALQRFISEKDTSNVNKSIPFSIMLSPTRELATQTYNIVKAIGSYTTVNIELCIGGTSISDTILKFKKGIDIIVGTPGRVNDLLYKKVINTTHINLLIIDEADEMFSQGFTEQIYNIFQYLPNDIQVGLFSATMTNEVLELTKKFMREPIKILIANEELTLEGIKQFYVEVSHKNKIDVLLDLYKYLCISQCIIFCNNIKQVEYVRDCLVKDNHDVGCIHGNLSFEERTQVFSAFKSGKIRILVSTDLLSRGIDVQQISIIINYELPLQIESYIHRIGRSGRFGRKGIGISLVDPMDIKYMNDIQNYYQTIIKELPDNLHFLNN